MWENPAFLVSTLVVNTLEGNFKQWEGDVHFNVSLKMTEVALKIRNPGPAIN